MIYKGDMIRTRGPMWTHKKNTLGFVIDIKYTNGGGVYYKIAVEGKRNHWHGEWNLIKTTPLTEAMREE